MAINEFSLALQRLYIEKYYGECIKSIKIKKSRLIFIMILRPSEESQAYTVKIECKKSKRPRVWLLFPRLETFNGNLPHHLYPAKKKINIRNCAYMIPERDTMNFLRTNLLRIR